MASLSFEFCKKAAELGGVPYHPASQTIFEPGIKPVLSARLQEAGSPWANKLVFYRRNTDNPRYVLGIWLEGSHQKGSGIIQELWSEAEHPDVWCDSPAAVNKLVERIVTPPDVLAKEVKQELLDADQKRIKEDQFQAAQRYEMAKHYAKTNPELAYSIKHGRMPLHFSGEFTDRPDKIIPKG